MKFRKKPIVIEAEQWLGPESKVDGVCLEGHSHDHPIHSSSVGGGSEDSEMHGGWTIPAGCAHVHTLEGPHYVNPGDWIITGVKNEKYPCKDDIFRMTYEKVEDA